jgi:excisionase family DNA binding protein
MEIDVAEAAKRLEVSGHEIRRLVRVGRLPARRVGSALLINADAVRRRMRIRPGRGRSLAPEMAWAVLWVMDGQDPSWLDSVHRSRARAWLREHQYDQIENLAGALSVRAHTERLRALPVHLAQIGSEKGLVRSGSEALGRDKLIMGGDLEFYCDPHTREYLVKRYGLREADDANLVLRVSRMPLAKLGVGEQMPEVIAAADLFESKDSRARASGAKVLKTLLEKML